MGPWEPIYHGAIEAPFLSHIEDPDPIEVKGGYQSDNPPIPTQVNMMRVICHPDKMDVVKPQVAECVAGYAAYAQSLPTTKFDGTDDFECSSVLEMGN